MSGVMMHLNFDRRWMQAAIPDAEITVPRLRADDATLAERLDKREAGSGKEEQVRRSLRQARHVAAETVDGALMVGTDGRTPGEVAAIVPTEVAWLKGAS
ncbi:MAG: hypothetical protein ACRCVA_13355 [Phreatobacter sp.]